MRNRIKLSQNFLTNTKLVRDLISKSSIANDDTVLEIGAGDGIITKQLVEKAKRVVSYEVDTMLYKKLLFKFQQSDNLELRNENFLADLLPTLIYKVFSNIPFNITSDIIKKLTLSKNPPRDSYLIVQKEAAIKFIGKPSDIKNSQMAVILYPLFELKIVHTFQSSDFFPRPNVNIILLQIKLRKIPLINNQDMYRDLVTYVFNQPKPNIKEGLSKIMDVKPNNLKPSQLEFGDWLELFEIFLKLPTSKQNIVKNSFSKQLIDQNKLEKIHRTRLDENWKDF